MFKYKKILALSPHTDDIELGCGGTLKKLKEEGAEIHVVNMCLAKPLSEGDITNEFKDSMKLLDIDWCEMMSLPVRNLYKHRQEILDFLIKIHHNNHYDLVFCHSTHDLHQDHQTVTTEAIRAFKKTSILGYELPWNCLRFSTDIFIPLEEKHIAFKKKLLECYKTQQDRPFMAKQYVYDMARTRGLQINKDYAESFECIRLIS